MVNQSLATIIFNETQTFLILDKTSSSLFVRKFDTAISIRISHNSILTMVYNICHVHRGKKMYRTSLQTSCYSKRSVDIKYWNDKKLHSMTLWLCEKHARLNDNDNFWDTCFICVHKLHFSVFLDAQQFLNRHVVLCATFMCNNINFYISDWQSRYMESPAFQQKTQRPYAMHSRSRLLQDSWSSRSSRH